MKEFPEITADSIEEIKALPEKTRFLAPLSGLTFQPYDGTDSYSGHLSIMVAVRSGKLIVMDGNHKCNDAINAGAPPDTLVLAERLPKAHDRK